MSTKHAPAVSLGEYITRIGEAEFAKKYGCSIRAARSYRFDQRKPKAGTARRVVEDPSSGMTWESIYFQGEKPAARNQPKRGRSSR
jgi:hypothetical protein